MTVTPRITNSTSTIQLNYKALNLAKTISPPKHNAMYFIPITQSAEASWTDSEDQAMFLHRRCLTLGQAALYRHYEALWNKIWSGCCSCGDRNTYRITGPEIKAVIHSRSNVGGWTSHNVVNEWQETCWWLRVQYNEAFNSKSPSFNKWLTKGLHMWHCWSGKRMWIPLSLQFDSLNWVDGFSAWSHGWQKTGGALLTEASLFAR